MVGEDQGNVVTIGGKEADAAADKGVVDMDDVHPLQQFPAARVQGDAEVIARVGNGNAGDAHDVGFVADRFLAAGHKEPDLLALGLQLLFEQGDMVDHPVDVGLVDIGKEGNAHG